MIDPHDDESISNDDWLIRRVHPLQIVNDRNTGDMRLSNGVYSTSSKPSHGMSVDLRRSIEDAGLEAAEWVRDPINIAAVEFQVELAREIELSVGKEPLKGNPHHGEVWRLGSKRFTKRQQATLREGSRWLIEIPGVSIR